VKKRTSIVLGVVAALALATVILSGCGGASTSTGETSSTAPAALTGSLTIAGSDTMVNMAQAWAESFMSTNPGVQLSVKGGGSGTGIAALINGTVDFADASREMKAEETSQAVAKGIDPVATKVARDGIAIIVNPANKVDALTSDQLGKIYRGEITNWSQVGGANAPITLLSRDPSSGTYELFKGKIIGGTKNFAKSTKLLPSTQAIVDEVKANANGIGYIGIGYESSDIKILKLDGIAATQATVKDETYPLWRFLYMYSNGEPAGVAKAYVDWILGPDGQKVVTDQGFVTLQ
jgi:phosphate transport system substrate-binding protein